MLIFRDLSKFFNRIKFFIVKNPVYYKLLVILLLFTLAYTNITFSLAWFINLGIYIGLGIVFMTTLFGKYRGMSIGETIMFTIMWFAIALMVLFTPYKELNT